MRFTANKYPKYKIGKHTYGDIVIHGMGVDNLGNNYVEIGDYCSLANGLQLQLGGNHDTASVSSYPFLDGTKPFDRQYGIYIGSDVWTGLGVIIRHGVTVGSGSVIGLGSIVLHDVPPYAIVAGNPAKLIRYRFSPSIISKLLVIKWWDWDYETIMSRLPEFEDVESFCDRYFVA
jgi:acetyltransferase-like isoleucine patch superfamily enzyme